MTTYQMTTINSGTRIRTDHNTFAAVVTSVPNAGTVVTGTELWTAPADGSEVKAGDKWVFVTYGMYQGWMALIHKGVAICKDFKVIADPTPTDPPAVSFPDSFTLTNSDPAHPDYGKAGEYKFVRVIG